MTLRADRAVRWEASARDYVERLIRAGKLVEESDEVKVLVQNEGSVMLLVADIAIMVSAPRLAEQAELEGRITERLCPDAACAMLVDSEQLVGNRVQAPGRWQKTDGESDFYRTAQGWLCQFTAGDPSDSKERLCLRLVSEIQQLAAIGSRSWKGREELSTGRVSP